jgi:drug/metabolite transporter (DMT)-like permease
MNWPGHVGGHWEALHVDFTVVLAVSALTTAALCLAAVTAYRRRGSRAYLLVTLALAALVAQPVLGGLAMVGAVSPAAHHTLEHGADAVIVVLVLGAVYDARRTNQGREVGR